VTVVTTSVAAEAVRVIDFKIAGGKTVAVSVTDSGPVPAENDRVKIEVAGMLILPSFQGRKGPFFLWNFAFRSKDGRPVSGVLIEDVTVDPIIELVADQKAHLQDGTWSGRGRPIAITREDLPWVFEPKDTLKVFRFTIRHADGGNSILHQLAWYSGSAKDAIRKQAEKGRSGG